MEDVPADEAEAVPALLFRVQSRLCALPIVHVVETMRPLPVTPFNGAPVAVKGIAIIRGMPVPVIALAILLDDIDESPGRFITVKTGNGRIALAVAAVLGVHHITAHSLQQLPPLLKEANDSVISAIGAADAELLFVLHAARLMPDAVWSALLHAGAPQP